MYLCVSLSECDPCSSISFLHILTDPYIHTQTHTHQNQNTQSSVMTYGVEEVPEARFNYDVSPMSVIVKKTGRRWYEFVTSLFGILGGTFTVVGLVDSTLHRLLKSPKLRS